MTAATVTRYDEVHDPMVEVVLLEASDGETYVSRKFSTVLQVLATAQVDDDGEINATISGRTVTINAAGMTDKAITLQLRGLR